MNVHLSEESRRFVADQVATGRYPSEDAVLEDALCRMRQQERHPAGGRPRRTPSWGCSAMTPASSTRSLKRR